MEPPQAGLASVIARVFPTRTWHGSQKWLTAHCFWTVFCRNTPAMISSEVRTFLAKYVDSAELLDILMLLHREPDQVWTADSVSNRVFTVPQAAERRLEELEARRLVVQRSDVPGAYELKTGAAEIERALVAVRHSYDANRAALISVVFSMKSDPVQSFSDAFRLRGDS